MNVIYLFWNCLLMNDEHIKIFIPSQFGSRCRRFVNLQWNIDFDETKTTNKQWINTSKTIDSQNGVEAKLISVSLVDSFHKCDTKNRTPVVVVLPVVNVDCALFAFVRYNITHHQIVAIFENKIYLSNSNRRLSNESTTINIS